jgi:acyl carrier protein
VFETLRDILRDLLRIQPELITPEASMADLDVDSLAMVELSMELEKAHGLTIDEAELHELNTVGDLVGLMERKEAAR